MKIALLVLTSLPVALCQSLPFPAPGMPASSPGSGGDGHCTPASGYAHCRVLTIDHRQVGGSTLTGFPVLVSATLGPSRIQNASCYDVVFTSDSAGTTKIPWEQETCLQGTGAIVDWVNVSSISSSVNTVIYISYDNSGISTAQNSGSYAPANVWDSNFKGVWHFGAGLNLADSTANAANGTTVGVWSSGSGQVSTDAEYVGGNGINVAFTDFARPMTLELWTNGGVNSDFIQAASYSENFLFYGNGTRSEFWTSTGAMDGTNGELDGNWHHLVATVDGTGNGVYYVDGIATGTGTDLTPHTSTSIHFGFGILALTPGKALDETRISNVARSGAWVTAAYNNQKKLSTFVTIGSEI